MRVFAVIIASGQAYVHRSIQRSARQAEVDDRRFMQLVDMMKTYNPNFDERTYFAYGCNCHLLQGEFEFYVKYGNFT